MVFAIFIQAEGKSICYIDSGFADLCNLTATEKLNFREFSKNIREVMKKNVIQIDC